MKSLCSKLTLSLTTALSLLAGACVEGGPTTDDSESALSANLVDTTYYDCATGQIVGGKVFGCVSGPAARWGRTTACFEVDSDTCDTAEPIEVEYCAFNTVCESFPAPEEPDMDYPTWLAAQQ